MNIFVYSDESGVFDKAHNDYFTFGGIICLGKESKETWIRKYSNAEKVIRNRHHGKINEVKATTITCKERNKLFRSLNQCYKFGIVVYQKKVLNSVFNDKKTKQRYLDYVYKIALKNALKTMESKGIINYDDIENIYCFVDEHTTATNGRYELEESLLKEYKYGTHNFDYCVYYQPIIPKLKSLKVVFCNSESKLLIRAADIVANKIYGTVTKTGEDELHKIQNLYITHLP